MSTGLDIGMGSEEIKKVLHDQAARGLMSQEEAQMQESQKRQLEAQEEEGQAEEAQAEESQAEQRFNSCVDQMGECIDEKGIRVSFRLCKKPAWMIDFM